MADRNKWTLKKFKETIDLCLNCGACYARGPIVPHNWRELPPPEWSSPLHKCPSFEYYRFRSHTGYGRLTLATLLFLDRISISDDLIKICYTCTSCGICNEICPTFQPLYGILALREEIIERGFSLPEPLSRINENIKNHYNVFGLGKRAKSLEGLPAIGEDVYFTGCYTSYLLPEIARTTVEILRMAGINVTYLGSEERCCGEMLRQEGNLKLFKEQAIYNIEAMKKAGAKRVIVSCAHCYRTWKMDYPNVIGDLPFEVIHVSELFAQLLKEGKMRFNKQIRKDITYHDPCFLGRFGGQVYDAPRKVLESIPGIEFKEMGRYGRWAYCCGAGGKITLNCYPKFSDSVGTERVLEAKEAANTLVTACPVCFNHMRKLSKRSKIELQVVDLSVMVAEAMGI